MEFIKKAISEESACFFLIKIYSRTNIRFLVRVQVLGKHLCRLEWKKLPIKLLTKLSKNPSVKSHPNVPSYWTKLIVKMYLQNGFLKFTIQSKLSSLNWFAEPFLNISLHLRLIFKWHRMFWYYFFALSSSNLVSMV